MSERYGGTTLIYLLWFMVSYRARNEKDQSKNGKDQFDWLLPFLALYDAINNRNINQLDRSLSIAYAA